MAEVSDITIKRTQDSLGKLIKKPALTEKLLRKPPFKFLHDIIRAVITSTGFLDGLFTAEELLSENIKDRDAKIAFLQKTIDALKLATKQDVKARPSKIVAGLEADKTNELLIAIARAIDRKVDTTEAVALVKSGKHNVPQKKEPKPAKATDGDSRKPVKQSKNSKDSKESTTSRKAKGSETKGLKKTNTTTKVAKQSSKDSTGSNKVNEDKEKVKSKEREKKTIKTEAIEKPVEIAHVNGTTVSDARIEDQKSMPNNANVESNGPIEERTDLPNEKPVKLEEPLEEKQEEKREERSAKLKRSDTVDIKQETIDIANATVENKVTDSR